VRSALRAGAIAAVEVELRLDAGAGGFAEDRLAAAVDDALAAWAVSDFRFHAQAVATHNPPSAAVAGRGLFFALESHLDEIAAALGSDPLELRLGSLRSRDAQTERVEAVLSAGAREIGWNRRWKTAAGQGPKRRGLGMAAARRGSAVGPRATAQIQLGEDGSFSLRLGRAARAEAEGVLARIAAEALGVAAAEVVLASGDTDFTPPDAEAGAPTLATTVAAILEAAQGLRAAMIGVGARLLGSRESELVVDGGTIRGPGGRTLRFAEIGGESLRSGPPLVATASREATEHPPAAAAFFAEVETDLETGQIRVRRLVAAVGCGPVAEAGLVETRIRGEALRGVGHALAGSLPDPCPTAVDEPEVLTLFVPSDRPATPFGDTHTAELATRAVAAAVANAVAQAAGPRLAAIPLTPALFLDRTEASSP
jgi:CO/xanthine dehydrogenase Mo-binding subunit